ncbi:MAG: DUF2007 domain-containing protein [Cohaesibacteraceae bacterium]|nr:DUF2007 domain-containing protein [Cohaesibacteraceae bacterium]PCH82631.1 MAG: hypothetical protein COB90_00695 [Hyphomicrobiales bacterium]
MRELVRTNDMVMISFIESLLRRDEILHLVVDGNTSVLEGSVGILPRRILVDDSYYDQAATLMRDAGIENELREI